MSKNCRNAFQIYLNLENCMIIRASFAGALKGDMKLNFMLFHDKATDFLVGKQP